MFRGGDAESIGMLEGVKARLLMMFGENLAGVAGSSEWSTILLSPCSILDPVIPINVPEGQFSPKAEGTIKLL